MITQLVSGFISGTMAQIRKSSERVAKRKLVRDTILLPLLLSAQHEWNNSRTELPETELRRAVSDIFHVYASVSEVTGLKSLLIGMFQSAMLGQEMDVAYRRCLVVYMNEIYARLRKTSKSHATDGIFKKFRDKRKLYKLARNIWKIM